MNRLIKLSILISCVLMITACGSFFDEVGVEKAINYADEIIPASDGLIKDTIIWLSEVENEEYVQKLTVSMGAVNSINEHHWEERTLGGFDEQEMQKWSINMSTGDHKWTIEGSALAEGIYNMHDHSSSLVKSVESFMMERGSLSEGDRVELEQLIERMDHSINELKYLFMYKE